VSAPLSAKISAYAGTGAALSGSCSQSSGKTIGLARNGLMQVVDQYPAAAVGFPMALVDLDPAAIGSVISHRQSQDAALLHPGMKPL